MGKRNKAKQKLLRSSLALLTALAPFGWANALHAQRANSDAQITNSQSTTAPKPSERYKNETFWKSISDSDREILDHFGINAAAKLYRYAHGLQTLLIKLGASIDKPLPQETDIRKENAAGQAEASGLPAEMNQPSKPLITKLGFPIHSILNSQSNQLEDTLLQIAKKQPPNQPLALDISQKLQTISNQLKGDEDSKAIDLGEIKSLATKANELREIGHYSAATEIWEQISGKLEKALGPDHPDTATSLNNLALLHNSQGLYTKAEPLFIRALAIFEKTLGPDHPDTAKSINNLALLHNNQGLYTKAEPLFIRALAIKEKTLGPDHPDTATSIDNLALLYNNQGLYTKAEPLFIRALAIKEKTLGPDHPDTATSLNNLALLHNNQGLYTKAEPLFIRALAIKEKTLGPDHPDTATSLNNLALLHNSQGLYTKAEPLFIRALAIFEKTLGPDHPDTAKSINNLALLHNNQGLYTKAEPLFIRALAIKEKTLGPDHPDTATSLDNLARLYDRQGLYTKAEPLLIRALAIKEKTLGPDHPGTATSLNNLALLHNKQGLYTKAEPLFIRALAIKEKTLGPDHPDTATSLNNLARLYNKQGLYTKAEPLYIRALAIFKKALGPDHPYTAISLKSLSGLYYNQRQYAKSVSTLRQGLEIDFNWLIRELPILANQNRESQITALGNAWEWTFGLAKHDPQATELALKTRLNRQGLLADIAQRQALLANAAGIDQTKVQQLQALTQQLASVSLASDLRAALREQQDRLQAELNRKFPELELHTVTLKEIAQSLPTGSALVEFQRYRPFDGGKPREQRWGEAQYIALILKPDGSVASVQLGLAAAIDEAIYKALAASAQDQQDAEILWAQVSDRILKPLLPHLNRSSQWFISPDGELNRVPFAALPAPQQPNSVLAEAVKLRLITTGRELVRLQKANPAGSKPLVMANPSFDRKGVSSSITTIATASQEPRHRSADLGSTRWSALPASQQEGEQIASLLSTPLVSGAAATTSALESKQGPRVLHIATHGFFVADQENKPADPLQFVQEQAPQLQGLRQEDPQLRSGLVLAGANQPDTDPNDDGYLTAAEAVMLNLKGTELVVLSACSTGQGDIRTGEGVYGLQRSLTVAGARSTLLSLWKVDDAATADFMTRFYTRLKAGEARSDALAATQKEFRDGTAGNGQWTSPFYWAAWQLVGDWRPIQGL